MICNFPERSTYVLELCIKVDRWESVYSPVSSAAALVQELALIVIFVAEHQWCVFFRDLKKKV